MSANYPIVPPVANSFSDFPIVPPVESGVHKQNETFVVCFSEDEEQLELRKDYELHSQKMNDSNTDFIRRMAQFGKVGRLAYIEIDEKTKSVFYSETLANVFERTEPEQLFGVALISRDDLMDRRTLLDYLCSVEEDKKEDFRVRMPNDIVGVVTVHTTVCKDEQGQILERSALIQNVTEIRLQEELLRDRDFALVQALRASHIGIWQYDLLTGETYIAEEVNAQFDYPLDLRFSLDEVFEKVCHQADSPMARQWVEQAAKTGQTIDIPVRFFDGQGNLRFAYVIGVVGCDTKGMPRRIIGLVFDVTETKKQEIALNESETRYRALFELANDAILLMEDQKFVSCNQRMLKLFSAESQEDLIGKSPWEISPEYQPDGILSKVKAEEMIETTKVGEVLKPFEWKSARLDGTEFYSNVSLTRIPYDGKDVFLVLIRDVTEERDAHEFAESHRIYLEVLAEIRRFFYGRNEKEIISAFLESVTKHFQFAKTWYGEYGNSILQPIMHFGDKADIVDITDLTVNYPDNDQVVFPLSYAILEKSSCHVNKLQTNPQFRKWHQVAVDGGFHSAIALPFEVNGQCEGGFMLYSEATEISLRRLEYLQTGVKELSRIISERRLWEEQKRVLKLAKEKAEAAAEAKSRFLANMSHEIRTPMTAILGYTELLVDRETSKGKLQDAARIIRNNAEYLLHILNDILDYSKIEAEMLKIEMRPFRLEILLAEIESLFSAMASEKGLDFKITNSTPYPSEILSDPIRLKQVLLNLVGNSIKFTDRGSIEINISWAGDASIGFGQLRIDINDTGVGIPEDSLEKIFTPFEQHDNSSTRKYGGTGLGLAISRRLMRLLCGNLTVKSKQNEGSSFSIYLPQYTSPKTAWSETMQLGLKLTQKAKGESPKHDVSQLSGCRILLVEDGKDNQRLFSMILQKAGADVVMADNGQVAVEMLEQSLYEHQQFDLILMDMQMPIMDGYTATELIRKKGYTKPIIALTAHAMSEERNKCIASGCNDFITKPIMRDALITAVTKNIRNEDC